MSLKGYKANNIRQFLYEPESLRHRYIALQSYHLGNL